MNKKNLCVEAVLKGKASTGKTNKAFFFFFAVSAVAMTPVCITAPEYAGKQLHLTRCLFSLVSRPAFHNTRMEKLPAISDVPAARGEGGCSFISLLKQQPIMGPRAPR